ncbi:SH3 type 3 domain protein [Methylobacterium sp. 4-46]|uniref:SH3 domain-containing protein n=1 Tax=unclassified Methylobacterium TaxID=2615210 RepID=UPI000152D272|nr:MULTISPECIES: SH3 domain-containing protein [Methylobacterium]ACA19188.1 SH3 type 3 domain protein [Methylobacterium sp. 4-46]WFT78396.1 SH3 domain-containing protein [Methylobacterium nodulans]
MRRIRLAAAALVLATGAALAQSETFRVDDVPPGDSLSIREAPDAAAPAVGRAPWDARLRGFGCTTDTPSGRTWCRVKYGRIVGWARRKFLAPE